MNNLINMSNYEKIIFVNNFNESNNNSEIETLSKNYPFVVFFTNNEELKDSLGYPVANIWKGVQFNDELVATRLTRFIGVDKESNINNSIEINGHVIKLRFNYDTGLIGLYEESTNLFIYTGYEYPNNETVNESNIIRFTESEIGTREFWNWRNNTYDIGTANFYIAIPAIFFGQIKPRCELYTKTNTNINNGKSYLDVSNGWFELDEPTTINGTRFIVYKSKSQGIFHGKIQ